jgi:hypothetical protein
MFDLTEKYPGFKGAFFMAYYIKVEKNTESPSWTQVVLNFKGKDPDTFPALGKLALEDLKTIKINFDYIV